MNARIRSFASYAAGDRHHYTRTVTADDVADFARVSGDDNAVHLDDAFARRTRFGGRVVHGALSVGFMAAAQTALVGAGVIWVDASVRFTAPVRIGDTVTTTSEIAEVQHDRRMLKLRSTARRADGTVVLTGESTVKHLKELESS